MIVAGVLEGSPSLAPFCRAKFLALGAIFFLHALSLQSALLPLDSVHRSRQNMFTHEVYGCANHVLVCVEL